VEGYECEGVCVGECWCVVRGVCVGGCECVQVGREEWEWKREVWTSRLGGVCSSKESGEHRLMNVGAHPLLAVEHRLTNVGAPLFIDCVEHRLVNVGAPRLPSVEHRLTNVGAPPPSSVEHRLINVGALSFTCRVRDR
jgi:hypothetical protein